MGIIKNIKDWILYTELQKLSRREYTEVCYIDNYNFSATYIIKFDHPIEISFYTISIDKWFNIRHRHICTFDKSNKKDFIELYKWINKK